jgi:hypothetical protein
MDPTDKKTARTKTPFDGPSQAPNGGITPDGEDDIRVNLKNLEQQMQLYYEEQSEQQYDVQLEKSNKKHRLFT